MVGTGWGGERSVQSISTAQLIQLGCWGIQTIRWVPVLDDRGIERCGVTRVGALLALWRYPNFVLFLRTRLELVCRSLP